MSDTARTPAWVPEEAQGTFATREVPGVSVPTSAVSVPASAGLPDPDVLAAGVRAGDRGLLARAITLVESNAPRHRPAAREVLRRIAGSGEGAVRVGISGVPGAGKSTFIEAFGNLLCDAGHRVAVLAVDPSSSLSGGSILGDKTRMETLSRREECFIRPSPSGGALGGVTRKTRETIALCEAAGYDVILVETVGVGQNEIAVRAMVDAFLLLLIAGAGDELQGMKKGIFEIADLLAVNKADGENRPRALATRSEFERVLFFLSGPTAGWQPPVLAVSSRTREGIAELWAEIQRFLDHVRGTGMFFERRRHQEIEWWRQLVEQELRTRFLSAPAISAEARRLEDEILAGRVAPSVAAEELLARFQP